MSPSSHAQPSPDIQAAHGNLRSHFMGLVVSLVLTIAAFGAVMSPMVPRAMRLPAIVVLCVAQLYVQLVYFLHMGAARGQRQNAGIFACTTLLIAIVVAGSLWVMHNANINMMSMPMSVQDALNRQ